MSFNQSNNTDSTLGLDTRDLNEFTSFTKLPTIISFLNTSSIHNLASNIYQPAKSCFPFDTVYIAYISRKREGVRVYVVIFFCLV